MGPVVPNCVPCAAQFSMRQVVNAYMSASVVPSASNLVAKLDTEESYEFEAAQKCLKAGDYYVLTSETDSACIIQVISSTPNSVHSIEKLTSLGVHEWVRKIAIARIPVPVEATSINFEESHHEVSIDIASDHIEIEPMDWKLIFEKYKSMRLKKFDHAICEKRFFSPVAGFDQQALHASANSELVSSHHDGLSQDEINIIQLLGDCALQSNVVIVDSVEDVASMLAPHAEELGHDVFSGLGKLMNLFKVCSLVACSSSNNPPTPE